MNDLEITKEAVREVARLMVDVQLCASVSEGVRLIQQGAVSFVNESTDAETSLLFKVGKRKYKRVKWKLSTGQGK